MLTMHISHRLVQCLFESEMHELQSDITLQGYSFLNITQ